MFIARAAAIHRSGLGGEPTLLLLARGFEAISQGGSETKTALIPVAKSGDSSLRLEKFALEWAETQHPELLESALTLVEKPNKARSSAYQMVLLLAGAET